MRVERCFAFVDLCGFTELTEKDGDEHAVVVLARFRTAMREIAARRGVRIAKWLGDGAMLSCSQTEPTVAMVLELVAHAHPNDVPLEVRAGLTRGPVIMFEGDDYIGRATNIASRLCDVALPGQVLATRDVAAGSPAWVAVSEPLSYPAQGFDMPLEAARLGIAPSDVMVRDAHCGLVLPKVLGMDVRTSRDGVKLNFCSPSCALAWEQEQRNALLHSRWFSGRPANDQTDSEIS